MRIALIGVGQAGGKIADRLLEYDVKREDTGEFVQGCIAVNTARQDLQGLNTIPEDNRILIGESTVKGNGVGADNTKGRDVMAREYNEVISNLDDVPIHKVDAFVISAALGGGTGSGGLPVLARELKKTYSEPVYGIGVLPSKDEGTIYSLNAARSLESCVEQTDNLMVFDNDLWSRGQTIESAYENMNQKIAERFGTLFSAGEIREGNEVAQSVVDASEVINTLECGGITSIGYAESKVQPEKINPGLLKRFTSDTEIDQNESTARMRSLAENSISGQLTIQANIESTERALIVFSGPSKLMTRKGTEEGRKVVEDRTDCMEVRGGDYPRNTNSVSATVVLSGLYSVPRIKELQQTAVKANDQIEETRGNRDENLESLLEENEAEEIDSLLDE